MLLPARRHTITGTSHGRMSVSLCLSVSSRSSIETDERIELVFGTRASFHPAYTVLKDNLGISKRVLPSGTFSQTPNFASVYRSSKRVIALARQDGRPERDKLDRRQSTKLTIPPSSDARLLAYHSNHKALSTAHFRRAGQLVTADTCYVVGYFLAS